MISERERLVQARDEAWEEERVAWGAVLQAKQTFDAAERTWGEAAARALEKARNEYREKLKRFVADAAALSRYDETHKEGGR